VDEKELSFKALLKSKLFKWPLLNYIRNTIALVLTYVFVFLALNRFSNNSALHAAFGCLLANVIADSFLFIKSYLISIKTIPFKFPLKKLFEYCLASAVMVIALKILNPVKSFETLFTISVGGFIYFICLFLMDFEARILFKKFLVYIKKNYNLGK